MLYPFIKLLREITDGKELPEVKRVLIDISAAAAIFVSMERIESVGRLNYRAPAILSGCFCL